jgi:hypothetical protein
MENKMKIDLGFGRPSSTLEMLTSLRRWTIFLPSPLSPTAWYLFFQSFIRNVPFATILSHLKSQTILNKIFTAAVVDFIVNRIIWPLSTSKFLNIKRLRIQQVFKCLMNERYKNFFNPIANLI